MAARLRSRGPRPRRPPPRSGGPPRRQRPARYRPRPGRRRPAPSLRPDRFALAAVPRLLAQLPAARASRVSRPPAASVQASKEHRPPTRSPITRHDESWRRLPQPTQSIQPARPRPRPYLPGQPGARGRRALAMTGRRRSCGPARRRSNGPLSRPRPTTRSVPRCPRRVARSPRARESARTPPMPVSPKAPSRRRVSRPSETSAQMSHDRRAGSEPPTHVRRDRSPGRRQRAGHVRRAPVERDPKERHHRCPIRSRRLCSARPRARPGRRAATTRRQGPVRRRQARGWSPRRTSSRNRRPLSRAGS